LTNGLDNVVIWVADFGFHSVLWGMHFESQFLGFSTFLCFQVCFMLLTKVYNSYILNEQELLFQVECLESCWKKFFILGSHNVACGFKLGQVFECSV